MATCKDCIHNSVCELWRREEGQDAKFYDETEDGKCGCFKDKSRFVELPCKVGNTLWIIVDKIKVPLEARVRSMVIGNNTIDFNCAVKGYFALTVNDEDFGETVFFTREEAEAEMQKRMPEPTTVPDNSEHCVCCGDVIPEGRQVCPKCEKGN